MKYDAIVIGGGPSGSTVATRLVQRGRRVLLLEKEHFPRFHIGESMLPCLMPLLEDLGAMPAILAQGFCPNMPRNSSPPTAVSIGATRSRTA